MDKLKVSIVDDFLHSDQKTANTPTKPTIINQFKLQDEVSQNISKAEEDKKHLNESIKKLERNSSKKMIQKYKVENESEPIKVDIIKKDEGVQTPTLDKVVV
jgi:ribosomal protein S1